MNKYLLACVLTAGLAAPALATPVTSLMGTTYTFPNNPNYYTTGPETVAPGIVWTGTYTYSDYGYPGSYGLGGNGTWTGALGPAVAVNSPDDSMTFAFASPVSGVGSFMNYAPDNGTPTIAVYDSSNTLIESYNPVINTTGNDQGAFFGFSETSPDISYFTLSNAYLIADDLVVNGSPAPVPEPSSLPLLLAGLAAIGGAFYLARKKAKTRTA